MQTRRLTIFFGGFEQLSHNWLPSCGVAEWW